jgi:hypothetical protein
MATNAAASFYQINPNGVADETNFQPVSHTGCPTFGATITGCYYSDALLAQVRPGVAIHLGYLARTTSRARFSAASINIGPPGSDLFDISNVEGYSGTPPAVQGQEIDKVGMASGWTYGFVTDPCFNFLATDVMSGENFTLMCQGQVSGFGQLGDSGAPVFTPWPDEIDVDLHGIMVSVYGSTEFDYTTFSHIYSELSLNPANFFFCAC